jgi:hypothetical protein
VEFSPDYDGDRPTIEESIEDNHFTRIDTGDPRIQELLSRGDRPGVMNYPIRKDEPDQEEEDADV